jgi:hypothetical protein
MGNACLSGSVNVPNKRGQWPRPPKQPNCLHCGAALWITYNGDRNKKFCNNSCATHYNMAIRQGTFRQRREEIEPCLQCHDLIDLKSRVSGRLVGLTRSFALKRRRRIGYDPGRVISATSKRVWKIQRPIANQRRKETEARRRVQAAQKQAWRSEWRGVIDCWVTWDELRRSKNRVKKYAWQAFKRATDWEWREQTRIRAKCSKIKWASPTHNKYITELGCTYWQAKKHIERQWLPGMSWENHGKSWEIDHIIAITRFDVNDPMQRLQMCHFTNLRPLWSRDNRRKRNRMEGGSSLQLVML